LVVQKKAVRILTDSNDKAHCRPLFKQCKIMTVVNMYIFVSLVYVKKNVDKLILSNQIHNHFTRSSHHIFVERSRLSKTQNSFKILSIKLFNKLPLVAKNVNNNKFVKIIQDWLVENPLYSVSEFLDVTFDDKMFDVGLLS